MDDDIKDLDESPEEEEDSLVDSKKKEGVLGDGLEEHDSLDALADKESEDDEIDADLDEVDNS